MRRASGLRRREFVALAAFAATATFAGGVAMAQPRPRILGVVLSGSVASSDALLSALRAGLAQRGWVEPDNLTIETRFDATDATRAASAAADVLTFSPDAILANNNIVAEQVLKLTRHIPVVFTQVGDPIDAGFVASYSQPGGNATGFTDFEPSHAGKWLGLLREIAPSIDRVGLMFNPDTAPRNGWYYLTEFVLSSVALAIEPLAIRILHAADIENAVAVQAAVGSTGIVIAPDALMAVSRATLIEAMARHHVPAIYPFAECTEEGGLMSYSVDMPDIFRRGGDYLGRILNGELPAVLPVQAPQRFQLALNLITARALGLTVPRTLLATADRVIE